MFYLFFIAVVSVVAGRVHTGSYVTPSARVDCDPQPWATKDRCIALGCYWDNNYDAANPTAPLCFITPETGYTTKAQSDSGFRLIRNKDGARNPYDEDFDEIDFTYRKLGPNTLKVTIGTQGRYMTYFNIQFNRYVPPLPVLNEVDVPYTETDDSLTISFQTDSIFSFKVGRNAGNVDIWDTSIGVLPFYLGLEPNGKAHGVLILNSNAQEFTTGPAPHFVYRTIGGQLDIYYFAGPTPEDVTRQYQELVGKPYLPAYWALGYQVNLC